MMKSAIAALSIACFLAATLVEDRIALHFALVCEWFKPRFRGVETLHYPPAGDPKAIWDRKALLFMARHG